MEFQVALWMSGGTSKDRPDYYQHQILRSIKTYMQVHMILNKYLQLFAKILLILLKHAQEYRFLNQVQK